MGKRDTERPLLIEWARVADLAPNAWNPNRMDEAMYAKELASIREFGFVDPVTVRRLPAGLEIIDGEHRVRACEDLGIETVPVVILELDDDQARELTIILNETRGKADEGRLAVLVKDLASRRDRERLDDILPFDRSELDRILEVRRIDWQDIERQREKMGDDAAEEPWVERVYRMPRSAATVIDDAIERVRVEHEIRESWRALEMIAADHLAGT